MSSDVQRGLTLILDELGSAPDLVNQVTAWPDADRADFVRALLEKQAGRRWLRGTLLQTVGPAEAAALAQRLMQFEEDFAPSRRDSTTTQVVASLPAADLGRSAAFFAGSNAAGAFWERVATEMPRRLGPLALEVLTSGGSAARETTLYILLLDPHSSARLSGPDRLMVLDAALNDQADEIRGIAADLLADEAPELLLSQIEHRVLDSSERVRMAAWDAFFDLDYEPAREAAFGLALDESAPIEPRRSAVAALSAILTTPEISPLLEALVSHPNSALAEDAVNILWTYHRAPAIASAAAHSPHESVRKVAERLLHPETGSPAAGGSRPGAPESPRDIYLEMLKGYERRED